MNHRLISLCLATMIAAAPLSWAGLATGTEPQGAPEESSSVSPELARKTASIARQTMSPFCPGRTLSDCPSPDAAAWRRDIREMLEKGMSASEIQATLEARTGGSLSGIPNHDSSYALPIGLATGAALVLYLVLARLRRGDESEDESKKKKSGKGKKSNTPPQAVDDDRLQAELDAED